jgi:BirA family transcriptional regulator, biotin operon repressor / biotin---[acetyl-CoA-carboxylase] ligase
MVTGMRGDHARSALAGTRFGDLRWVAETGSTNRDLLDLASDGAPDGVVLVADHQSAGRGRLDRTWVAPAGASLLLSVLLRPDIDPVDAPLVTVAMALAIVDAVTESVARVRVKWPNDVVVGGDPDRKLAGVLAESVIDRRGALVVVVGAGINVNWPVPLSPELEALAPSATALNLEVGSTVDRAELLVSVLTNLERQWGGVESGGIQGRRRLVAAARTASATVGRRVRADLGHRSIEGTATDLDERGDLVVIDDGGDRHVVVAGDVVHLRPA